MLSLATFIVRTGAGNECVRAMSVRHAVAIVVARMGLTEQQAACVVGWKVTRVG